MADRDILRLVVEQTAELLGRLRTDMAKRIPYGPSMVRQTPREARLELQKMDPQQKLDMIKQTGPAEWDKMMEELYNGR